MTKCNKTISITVETAKLLEAYTKENNIAISHFIEKLILKELDK